MTDQQVIDSLMEMARESGERGWWHPYGELSDGVYIGLFGFIDESALRRVVGGPDVMREQLEHLKALSAESHITVQVLPYTAGAHPGLSGQFSILRFADSPEAGVVYLERFAGDLCLEKPFEVWHHNARYDHRQAQALTPDGRRDFITDIARTYVDAPIPS
ncbi:DUF5753 domain-containing protein [Streptomyces sp. NPDC054884]|uniref:DUF5753 domain-containing protein n=1 Tax=Streptomyces sp. B21-105 TaxID=3039417 RepID=UPI002FF35243